MASNSYTSSEDGNRVSTHLAMQTFRCDLLNGTKGLMVGDISGMTDVQIQELGFVHM